LRARFVLAQRFVVHDLWRKLECRGMEGDKLARRTRGKFQEAARARAPARDSPWVG
jgi:hypothetical protein